MKKIEPIMKKLERMKVKIVYPLTKIGQNYVFEFKDTEGNDVEVSSKVSNNPKLKRPFKQIAI